MMGFVRRIVFLAGVSGLAVAPVRAQVQWEVADFRAFANGFTGVLRFRNIQGYTTAPILTISEIYLSASSRAQASCGLNCDGFVGVSSVDFVKSGEVQRSDFTDSENTRWVNAFTDWNTDGGISRNFMLPLIAGFNNVGVLGCQTPASPGQVVRSFIARTCLDDGIDGWYGFSFRFSVGPSLSPRPVFDESDVTPTFVLRQYSVLNSYVPEPSAYLLMATGLVGTALVRRRRRP